MQNIIYLCLTIITLSLFHTNNNSNVEALTSPSEIAALKAFKASIKASSITPWSCLASWNFTVDPCSVPRRTHFTCGLTCTPDSPSGINQITLDPAGYTGTLTPLISHLTKLITLDLSDNSFFGTIPSLSSLSNLQTLSLRSNSFSGPIPNSITTLNSLESIDFSHNSISGSLPNSMSSLISLRRIDLSFNKLTGSIPKLPPNLLELAIKANSLSGALQKATFEGLNQLEVVELSDNKLEGKIEPWFFLLPSLQQVDFENNSFTAVEISRPGGGSNLVAVNLGFNRIKGNAPANLGAYPALSFLSIRHNALRGAIPLEYGKSRSMKRLFLDGNYLVGKPPPGLVGDGASVSGSLGDNCLEGCPASSQLCTTAQKPSSVCKQAYRGRPTS